MKWIEATMKTKSEEIDDLCAQLEELSIQGIFIEDEADFQSFLVNNQQYWDYVDEELTNQYRGQSRIKFYVEDNAEGYALLEQIQKNLNRSVTSNVVDSEDWENNWRQYYQPIEIGRRLIIVPDWLETENQERIQLRLEPGLAFGTGAHATTQMCLEALDAMDLRGARVLDLGCGSGILGVGALVLGCAEVTACDIDPLAPEAARDNVKRNQVDPKKFRAFTGDILTDAALRKQIGSAYQIVLANIVSDVIIPLSGFVRQFMAEGAGFICSGVIDSRAEEVRAALKNNGFQIEQEKKKEEWYCFVCE